MAPHKAEKGIRPLCIGEPIYKACSTHLNATNRQPIANALLPINYGCCVTSGLDFASTSISAMLTEPVHRYGGMKDDVKNAFNEMDRRIILRRLYDEESLSSMWRLADWSYNEPSPVYVMDRNGTILDVIMCSQGVKQGCPLALNLFCIGLNPTIKEAVQELPGVIPIGIADDVTFSGPPQAVLQASVKFGELLPTIGLSSRADKKKFIWLHDADLPEDVASSLTEMNINTTTEGTIFAGIPIAATNDAIQTLLAPTLDSVGEFLKILQHPAMPKLEAYQFLQQSANARCINIARCLRPDFCAQFARVFDQMILDTFEDLTSLHLSEIQSAQVRLPFSKSGFGLRPLESISPCAYIGAAAAITPLWKPALGESWQTDYPLYTQTVFDTIDIVRDMIDRKDGNDLLPDDPTEFWNFHTDGKGRDLDRVQGWLTASSEGALFDAWKGSLSPGDRARVTSASQKFASMWQLSTASDTRIENNLFVKAVLLRLGSPGQSCSDPAAALSDKRTATKLKDLRHKFLTESIAKWAERAGAERAETEPKNVWTVDNLRPDIDLILGGERFLVDVAVVHPTSTSYVIEARMLWEPLPIWFP